MPGTTYRRRTTRDGPPRGRSPVTAGLSHGDDVPDRKQVLFTGVDGVQHDHGIHAFGPVRQGRALERSLRTRILTKLAPMPGVHLFVELLESRLLLPDEFEFHSLPV